MATTTSLPQNPILLHSSELRAAIRDWDGAVRCDVLVVVRSCGNGGGAVAPRHCRRLFELSEVTPHSWPSSSMRLTALDTSGHHSRTTASCSRGRFQKIQKY
jgi:hypothetical protein